MSDDGESMLEADAMSDMTAERLISMMALSMQNAQFALQNAKRDDVLDAALSSLTIVLKMEADYWQANLRRDTELNERLKEAISPRGEPKMPDG